MIDKEIKLSPYGVETYKLVITEESIQFIDKTLALSDVVSIRYGLKPIEFYKFYAGTTFIIELITKDDKLTITLNNYLGLAKDYFYSLFDEIIKDLWKSVIVRLHDEALEKYRLGETIWFGPIFLNHEGVGDDNKLILWSDLIPEYKNKMITLNSRSNHKLYTNLFYVDTPNIDILESIIKSYFATKAVL